MSSWLRVIAATVTCLSISPITCLPLHDVAGGSQRRELLRGSWGNPSGRGSETRRAGAEGPAPPAPASLLLDQSRAGVDDAGAVLDLLLALGRDGTGALYGDGMPMNAGQVDDGIVATEDEEGEAEAAEADKRGKSKVDDYGHGMFWGKRAEEPSWLAAGREADQSRGDRGQALAKRAQDDYGFGLFFGKRGRPDFEEDFPL